MEWLATELVPHAIEEMLSRYPDRTVQHLPRPSSEKNFNQSQAA
jgi:hypothetical protein